MTPLRCRHHIWKLPYKLNKAQARVSPNMHGLALVEPYTYLADNLRGKIKRLTFFAWKPETRGRKEGNTKDILWISVGTWGAFRTRRANYLRHAQSNSPNCHAREVRISPRISSSSLAGRPKKWNTFPLLSLFLLGHQSREIQSAQQMRETNRKTSIFQSRLRNQPLIEDRWLFPTCWLRPSSQNFSAAACFVPERPLFFFLSCCRVFRDGRRAEAAALRGSVGRCLILPS